MDFKVVTTDFVNDLASPQFSGVLAGVANNVAVQDVRNYQSIIVRANANGPGAPTAFNTWSISFRWSTARDGSVPTLQDTYELFASQGGGFATPGGRLLGIFPVRGPYLQVTVTNTGVDAETIFAHIWGVYNMHPTLFVETDNAGDVRDNSTVLNGSAALAAAGATDVVGFLAPGRARIRTVSSAASLNVTVTAGSLGVIDAFTVGAVTDVHELILPKRSVRVNLSNTAGAVNNCSVQIISDYQKPW